MGANSTIRAETPRDSTGVFGSYIAHYIYKTEAAHRPSYDVCRLPLAVSTGITKVRLLSDAQQVWETSEYPWHVTGSRPFRAVSVAGRSRDSSSERVL